MQRDDVIAHIAATRQVEVTVIGEIDHRCAVRRRGKVEDEAIVVVERVRNRCAQRAGVAFLAIHAHILEAHRTLAIEAPRPVALREAHLAAMQRIGALVGGQTIGHAIKHEARMRDPVAIAPHDDAEVGMAHKIGRQRIEAQHHVLNVATAIRHLELLNQRAPRQQRDAHAMAILQHDRAHRAAIRCVADDGGGRRHGATFKHNR